MKLGGREQAWPKDLGPGAEGSVWLSQSLPWARALFLLRQIRPGAQAVSIFL